MIPGQPGAALPCTELSCCVAAPVSFCGVTQAPFPSTDSSRLRAQADSRICLPYSFPQKTLDLSFLRSQKGRRWPPSISNHTLAYLGGWDFCPCRIRGPPASHIIASLLHSLWKPKKASTHFLTPPGVVPPSENPLLLNTFRGRNMYLGQ